MDQETQFIPSSPDQTFYLSKRVLQLYGEKDIHVLLNLLRLKEPEAYLHSLRVATLMEEVFAAPDDVLRGSLLHDIGKSSTPFDLTLCPRSLTDIEKQIVNIHTLLGVEILSGYNETIINCVNFHHEPSCPIEYVQQLRACDIYDAITSDRPYRVAQPPNIAIAEMFSIGISPDFINAIAKHKAIHYNESENPTHTESEDTL